MYAWKGKNTELMTFLDLAPNDPILHHIGIKCNGIHRSQKSPQMTLLNWHSYQLLMKNA